MCAVRLVFHLLLGLFDLDSHPLDSANRRGCTWKRYEEIPPATQKPLLYLSFSCSCLIAMVTAHTEASAVACCRSLSSTTGSSFKERKVSDITQTCMSCMFVYVWQFIHLSIYLSFYLSTYPSIYLSIHLSVHLSIYLSNLIKSNLSIYLSFYLSIYLSIYSIYRFYLLYLSIFLSIYPAS
jgi:hypothetical protein